MIRFSVVSREELVPICKLYQTVIADMRSGGLKQWEWGVYPNEDLLRSDIERGILYRMDEDGETLGAFAISPDQEEVYRQVAWHFGVKPATLHLLALKPGCYGLGLAQRVAVYVKEEARRLGYDSIRMDTSTENESALKLFRSAMKRQAGAVYFENPQMPFLCFESPLTVDCPILPIAMRPAYRYGEMTPWGSGELKNLFGKEIPDPRTGESLEISTIPGLESVDTQGTTLTKLIERYGERLTGKGFAKPFPLLLKILAAKESLSVQVHPDDAYASAHEGKLGKSEAWVILHAEKDASILYGIRQGMDIQRLRSAAENGEDLEPLIERVPVKAGDVYYMPSGMVHAIGGGIVLYEIQQSSDVTYRLWDFHRKNEKGEERPLHLKQAMDVINPRLLGERTTLPLTGEEGRKRLLSVPAFKLDCVSVNGEFELPERPESFRIMTALAGLLLSWKGDAIELQAGESVLLPAACPPVTLQGVGRALIARPQ